MQWAAAKPCPKAVHTVMALCKQFCPALHLWVLLSPCWHISLQDWILHNSSDATGHCSPYSHSIFPIFHTYPPLTSLISLPKRMCQGSSGQRVALVGVSENRRRCFPSGTALCPIQGSFRSCWWTEHHPACQVQCWSDLLVGILLSTTGAGALSKELSSQFLFFWFDLKKESIFNQEIKLSSMFLL